MYKKLLCTSVIALFCVGCSSEPMYAIDLANPELVKEADRIEYVSDAMGHFYDKDRHDIVSFVDILKQMKIQKIKPDPPITGGSAITLYKGDDQIISLGFAKHMIINGNYYQYELNDQTDSELRQLIQRLSNSSRQP
jgi:hypothetical protein